MTVYTDSVPSMGGWRMEFTQWLTIRSGASSAQVCWLAMRRSVMSRAMGHARLVASKTVESFTRTIIDLGH